MGHLATAQALGGRKPTKLRVLTRVDLGLTLLQILAIIRQDPRADEIFLSP